MKTLIVKLAALGDVVRTTTLLQELKGEIYWLTKSNALEILRSQKITKVYLTDNNQDIQELYKTKFDLIVSLDEEPYILEIVKGIPRKKIIGVFLDKKNKINYTSESTYWFDMSLSSKLGKEKADQLKRSNRKSVPEILIEMVGSTWHGQEYDLGITPNTKSTRIGLINVATGAWPNKNWAGYDSLMRLLKKDRHNAIFLGLHPTIQEHIKDINDCQLVVCGDTLGMHIALALKKKVVALFNCTSPHEIYDYGRLTKIISPLYEKYFYARTNNSEAQEAISVESVYQAVKENLT